MNTAATQTNTDMSDDNLDPELDNSETGTGDPSEQDPELDPSLTQVDGEGGDPTPEPANGELTVSIEGEDPEPDDAKAPKWVAELRKSHRAAVARNRELEQQLAARGQPQGPADPGPKPTLASCDFDATAFAERLDAWHDASAKHKAAQAEAQTAQQAQERAWQGKLTSYSNEKAELAARAPSFAEAEAMFETVFSTTQRGIVLQGAKKPALLVLALGKNPAALRRLAAIQDPVEFAMEVRETENKMKVGPTKKPAPPESRVRGGVTPSAGGAVDSQLARLRAEAEKSGDYSKVNEYKRQQKQKR